MLAHADSAYRMQQVGFVLSAWLLPRLFLQQLAQTHPRLVQLRF
jgi:hypothetical protein